MGWGIMNMFNITRNKIENIIKKIEEKQSVRKGVKQMFFFMFLKMSNLRILIF